MTINLFAVKKTVIKSGIILVYKGLFRFCSSRRMLYENEEGGLMENNADKELPKLDRDKLIDILTDELPYLRAKLGITQEDVSCIVGISRQTYSAVETKKRKMSWPVFMALLQFYGNNEKTSDLINSIGVYTVELKQMLNINRRIKEKDHVL